MVFHKKHYEQIARIIRDSKNKNERIEEFIRVFKADNPAFKEDLFIKATE